MLGKIKQMCLNSHLLCPVVDPFEHFAEGSLADPLLFGEDQLRIHFLFTKTNNKRTALLAANSRPETHKDGH